MKLVIALVLALVGVADALELRGIPSNPRFQSVTITAATGSPTTGGVRLPNNVAITGRNQSDSGDAVLLQYLASGNLQLGNVGVNTVSAGHFLPATNANVLNGASVLRWLSTATDRLNVKVTGHATHAEQDVVWTCSGTTPTKTCTVGIYIDGALRTLATTAAF